MDNVNSNYRYGGKLIWRLAVETKNAHFISAKFNIVRQCVGVHVRRDYRHVSSSESREMALFRYFSRDTSALKQSSSLTQKEKDVVSDFVSKAEKEAQRSVGYNEYTAEERAAIGKYTAENGPAMACRRFSKTLGKKIPESTARRLKNEYLAKVKEEICDGSSPGDPIRLLPTKKQGRPLLLGQELDEVVQEVIRDTRRAGGVINTTIVVATTKGVISAKNPTLLLENGGHLDVTSSYAKSVLKRMGYVKRKCSNAGKVTMERFEEAQEEFLADIKAEVLMHDIPLDLVFNWDQTGIHLVPTGEWTMHQAKDKIIPISHSDDKRQITGVFAVTATGKFFPPQLIYKGKTERCHPKVSTPAGWDVWHSDNHWSTEETMVRYIEKIIVPFVNNRREELKLPKSQHALAIFDCFKGQTTPKVKALLGKHHIRAVIVPANCTDKLQPLDISINKPFKDEIKKRFQLWYASEIRELLKESKSAKVDVSAAAIKHRSATWIISTWRELEGRSSIAVNGFRKAGILDAISSVLD